MNEAVYGLRNLLENEYSVYQELLELAEDQREALIYRETDTLTSIASQQGKLASHLNQLESIRVEMLEKLSMEMGLDAQAETLAQIIELTDRETAASLQNVRSKILEIIDRLAQLNRTNAMLLVNAQQMVQFMMKAIAVVQQEPTPCYPMSSSNNACGSILVDHRA